MKTERFSSSEQDIQQAAELLAMGELVAFPTETVYGLGANALDEKAVDKIFLAKGRPSDNPLIVHIGDMEQLTKVVATIPPLAETCIAAFWPGPLTLIMPRQPEVPDNVTAGLSAVGVRMPNHPAALALLRQSGLPIAAPSANRSGRPSPTTAEHVLEDLDGLIAGIVDGGWTGVGVESTVLDVTVDPPMILRPGGVTKEMLEQVIGEVAIDPSLVEWRNMKPEWQPEPSHSSQQEADQKLHSKLEYQSESDQASQPESGQAPQSNSDRGSDLVPRSPGMKYTHYAPKGEMWMVEGEWDRQADDGTPTRADQPTDSVRNFPADPKVDKQAEKLQLLIDRSRSEGYKTGVLTTDERLDRYRADAVLSCGSRQRLESVAAGLYHALREFDRLGIERIYAESFPEDGIGFAIMNRLRKAAGYRIIR